jgi:hypothetical protein
MTTTHEKIVSVFYPNTEDDKSDKNFKEWLKVYKILSIVTILIVLSLGVAATFFEEAKAGHILIILKDVMITVVSIIGSFASACSFLKDQKHN